jgi:hypothetical protein
MTLKKNTISKIFTGVSCTAGSTLVQLMEERLMSQITFITGRYKIISSYDVSQAQHNLMPVSNYSLIYFFY